MFTAEILNSEATLNNFIVLGGKDFIPGGQLTLVLRLVNSDLGIRYIPPAAATLSFTFNNLDGTELVKSGGDVTQLPDDRSIVSIVLEEAETEELQDGNITFEIDVAGDGTNIQKGFIQNALARIITGDC